MGWKLAGAMCALAMACAGGASADTFTLTNTTHPELYSLVPIFVQPPSSGVDGNGFATAIPGGYTITGPDLPGWLHVSNTTSLTAVAQAAESLDFNWTYSTQDFLHDSLYDPAGFVLNGVLTQLTINGQATGSGSVHFSLNPGDSYGFFVRSTDTQGGPGILSFVASPAPEPATWAMLIFGFGLMGWRLRGQAKRAPALQPRPVAVAL